MGRMFGYGFRGGIMEYLPYIIAGVVFLILIFAAIAKGRKGSNASLILEEFNYNEGEDLFLSIKGRAPGFWNWVKSLFGKAPTTYLNFNKQLFRCETPGLSHNIPLLNVSCVSYGMLKSSVLALILGIIFIGSAPAIHDTVGKLIGVVIGIILIIIYIVNRKTMYLGIHVNENAPLITVRMNKGIINSIELVKFEAAIKTLTETVLKNASTR